MHTSSERIIAPALLSACLLLASAGRAPAQTANGESADGETALALTPAESGAAAEAFLKGSWTLDAFAFATASIEGDPFATPFGGGVGGSYYVADYFALRAELLGVGVHQGSDDAAGVGFSLLARWHFYHRDRLTLFFEGGAGLLQSDVSVPDGDPAQEEDGTHFNFTPQASVGATYRLKDNLHLIGAARYLHISNANKSGEDENPGLDTVGGYVGLLWTF